MKYYAVRKGRTTGIFTDWKSCQESVKGYKGAEFKSFADLLEAKRYLGSETEEYQIDSDTLIAYVDGSYSQTNKVVGLGGLLLDHEYYIIDTFSKSSRDADDIAIRNVAGEIHAARLAIERAYDLGYRKLVINYDYEGIAKWCNGSWTANNQLTQHYQKVYSSYKKLGMKIYFNKIDAHTGEAYNELADLLAKRATELASYRDVLKQSIYCASSKFIHNQEHRIHDPISITMMTEVVAEYTAWIDRNANMKSELISDICTGGTLVKIRNLHSPVLTELTIRIRCIGNTLEIGEYPDDIY